MARVPKKLGEKQVAKLEEDITRLQIALRSWKDVGIPEKTLVILLNHYTKVPQRTIKLILEGMDALYDEYFTEEDEE